MIGWIIGAGVAGATYGLARKADVSKGKAAAAAAVTGVGGAVVTAAAMTVLSAVWPLALVGGAGYLGYRWMRSRGDRALGGDGKKMLGPGR